MATYNKQTDYCFKLNEKEKDSFAMTEYKIKEIAKIIFTKHSKIKCIPNREDEGIGVYTYDDFYKCGNILNSLFYEHTFIAKEEEKEV